MELNHADHKEKMEPEHTLTAPAGSGAGIKLLLASLLGIAIFLFPSSLAGAAP